MKARKVKGLDPDGTLADNAERIVRVRLDELWSFMPRALDPEEVVALHDMRIAAKRLRYILEVTAEPCFGPLRQDGAQAHQGAAGPARRDPRLRRAAAARGRARGRAARRRRARGARAGAPSGAEDLDPASGAAHAHATAWRGLATLGVYLQARRELLFERFLALWIELERDGFRARLEYAARERPASFTSRSPDGQRRRGRRRPTVQ